MKKKILFLIILLTIFIFPVLAEEVPFEFVNEIELESESLRETNLTRTLKTEDGNYVVSHGKFVLLVDPSGEVIWSQIVNDQEMGTFVDFYIENQYLIVTVYNLNGETTVIFKLSNGEYVNHFENKGGSFINKMNNNYIVGSRTGISLYDEDFNYVRGIQAYILSPNSITIKDNKIYALTCDKATELSEFDNNNLIPFFPEECSQYLYTFDKNLEIENEVPITDNKFKQVSSFFKVGDDFYVTASDTYRINPNGKSTKVVDSIESKKRYYGGIQISNYIVLGGSEIVACSGMPYQGTIDTNVVATNLGSSNPSIRPALPTVAQCSGIVILSVYDTDFNYLTDLPVIENEYEIKGEISDITPTKNGFVAKWYNNTNHTFNMTEYRFDYIVNTKTDGNGDVTVDKIKAKDGDLIKITITPKPGFVLDTMTITDEKGNKITTTNNTFVMPASDVVVEARFSPINPKTSPFIASGILIVAILSGISVIIYDNKKKQYE